MDMTNFQAKAMITEICLKLGEGGFKAFDATVLKPCQKSGSKLEHMADNLTKHAFILPYVLIFCT